MVLIFDIDGTICNRDNDNTQLYPEVIEFLRGLRPDPEDRIYLATNQGGVGLRWWMEHENWGDPEKFPTQEEVEERLEIIKRKIEFITGKEVGVRVCFAFITQGGNYAPIPMNREDDPRWQYSWRKPQPGMIIDILKEHPEDKQVIFVGDSEEDQDAAYAASVGFREAKEFFDESDV